MEDCLSNAVVLRKLFQHFSNSDLLRLSFVNKWWNYEARSLMRKRGNLIALLKFLDLKPCRCQENLEAFAADLLRMNIIPFSGIRIKLGHHRFPCQAAALPSTYETILAKLSFKILSVERMGDWSRNKHCPGSLLFTKVLQRFSGVLEEVSLAKFWSEDDNFIVGLVKDFSFPRLKVFKLGENYYEADGTHLNSTLKALVASAPKLQELHTQGPLSFMLNILEGRSVVLVLQSNVYAPFDEIPDNLIDAIRLEAMQLYYTGPGFDVERFNRITPMLLQASGTATLRSMECDAILALSLMRYGIHLENVRHLTIYINAGQLDLDEPGILRALKAFDFTRIFPKLTKVVILPPFDDLRLSQDHMDMLVEQAIATLKEPEPDRAVNIKDLDLSTSISSAAEFYAEMFPQIERLHVQEPNGVVCFSSVWKHWASLRDIIVRLDVQQNYRDLDSAICGILPEEAAELRLKDEEFLKKVNIVPVMPAITCLRNLRQFMLILAPPTDLTFGFPSLPYLRLPSALILSRVTGLVAFAKCPNLTVTISAYDSNIYEALRHLKPYASVYNMLPRRLSD